MSPSCRALIKRLLVYDRCIIALIVYDRSRRVARDGEYAVRELDSSELEGRPEECYARIYGIRLPVNLFWMLRIRLPRSVCFFGTASGTPPAGSGRYAKTRRNSCRSWLRPR